MRIHVLSDLHVEHAAFTPDPVSVDADIVVLAGDIGVGTQGIELARREFPDVPVIYVAGNHEYYGGKVEDVREQLRRAARGTNVAFLDEDEVRIGGVRFLGATLWSDFALVGAADESMAMAQIALNDFHLIRASSGDLFSPEDARALHARARAWLRARLAGGAGPIVVVTHHAPSSQSIPAVYRGHPLAAAFASELVDLVDGRASLWLHGHTHWAVDYSLRGTRVVSNARGYPSEPAPGYAPDLVVDIG